MKQVPIFLIALVLLALWSCETDQDEPVAFPKYLVWTGVKPKGKIRLFYDRKEIKDQAEIDRVVNDSSNFNSPVNRKDYLSYPQQATGDTVFVLSSPDTMRLFDQEFTSVWKDRKFTFTSVRSVEMDENPTVPTYLNFYKNTLFTGPHQSTFGPKYKARGVIVAYGDYSTLTLPVMGYFHKNSNRSSFVNGVFNEFNEEVIEKLQKGDTLLIQEYVYELKAK